MYCFTTIHGVLSLMLKEYTHTINMSVLRDTSPHCHYGNGVTMTLLIRDTGLKFTPYFL